MPNKYAFITVEGNIGAGKTTLTTALANDLGGSVILEQFADNPFLPQFYKAPERYAFPLEMFFMAERYQQLQDTLQGNLFTSQIISDYLFAKSILFAGTNLNSEELSLYKRVFSIIYAQLPQPDIILYLHKPVNALLKNIATRGRPYEAQIKPGYLQKIETAYFNYFRQIKHSHRIIVLDSGRIDFVKREIDYLHIKQLLSKNWEKGLHYI